MALYFLASLHITIDCKAVRTRFPELIAAGFPYRRSLEHCSNRFPGLIDRQREGMPNHTHTHDHKHNHECSEADASACRDSTLQGKNPRWLPANLMLTNFAGTMVAPMGNATAGKGDGVMLKDRYGNELSTSSTAARDAYGRGVDSLMAATAGTDTAFAEAVAADDGFALGHISLARAKQLLGRGHEAKAPRARALELAASTSPREQSHIAIFDKILTGQGEAALAAIREHLQSWPRDAMAFAPATSVFGLIGFCGRAGREQEQLEMIAPYEKHYGDDWWYRTQLAFAQIELGQFAPGERNIEKQAAEAAKKGSN